MIIVTIFTQEASEKEKGKEIQIDRNSFSRTKNNNRGNSGDRLGQQKTSSIGRKLKEIVISLNPVEYGFANSNTLKLKDIAEIIQIQERQFADEITAHYYIQLWYEHAFYTRIFQPHNYYSSHNGIDEFPISSKPKDCLMKILKADRRNPTIKKWLLEWKEDILKLQKQIYATLNEL